MSERSGRAGVADAGAGGTALVVLLLTAAGAFLRFWRLGYQSYWVDEGFTLGRITGTFEAMLQSLANQGFPPLWYVMLRGWCRGLEWVTGDGAWAFSPGGARGLGALCGTLTVPAMYFLARQWLGRRGALVVTLLAAVNPFLIYYARDIKMYAAFWLFVVLNMGIFFRGMTSHRHWFWFVPFAVTGAVMTGLHSMAWFVIGVQLVFVLTRPRLRAWDGPAWLVGAGLMALLPIYWFVYYLDPAKWMGRVTAEKEMGMTWMTRYTDMSVETLLGEPTSHVLGWLWPVYPPSERIVEWYELGVPDFMEHLGTRSWEWLARWEWWASVGMLGLLAAGLVNWDRLLGWRDRSLGWGAGRRGGERGVTRGRWWWLAVWIAVPTGVLALTWIPVESAWFGWVWRGFNPKPIWEPRYLGIVLPAWLIWLGWSLGRLPSWPVRWLVTGAVTGVCVASALSNHLVFRNAPYQHAGEIAERFIDRGHRERSVVGMPNAPFSYVVEDATYPWVVRVRPGGPEDKVRGAGMWLTMNGQEPIARWLKNMGRRGELATIVLTDRYGDVTEGAMSDAGAGELLGREWKLVYKETYRWHYEWRYYVFHTWRTRVWTRVAAATAPLPEAVPATQPTSGPAK